MTDNAKITIVSQTQVNSLARQILATIRLGTDEENPLFKPKDIYNERAYQCQAQLGPYSLVQAMMMALNKRKDYWMTYKLDKDLRIRRLFFAKTTSQKLLKLNYKVLLMDCIYKTNVYKMPLCIITRVTPLNTTYYVPFVFLSAETVDDYHWILGAVKKLYKLLDIPDPKVIVTDTDPSMIRAILGEFPLASHLLCLGHINKNVMANCKKLFEDEESREEFY